jgi:hypothetical protein
MAGLNLMTPSGGYVNLTPTNTATNVSLNLPAANGSLISANTGSGTFTTSNFNSASTFGFKNRIINGGMVINQRATAVTASGYTVDRWAFNAVQNSKATVQQSTSVYPVGFTASLGVTSSSSYSVLSGDYFVLSQPIEGLNCSDLAWGTASAKTVTLSFQVYSSLTGTFGGSLMNNAGNRCYPFSYTISSSNTWTSVSITIAGDTTGTWTSDTNVGIYVFFGLGAGSTYSGTAGSWAASNYRSSTGAVSVVGTNGATFYITGVQLEVGSAATSFDFRSYGTELGLCQRYYEIGLAYLQCGADGTGYRNSATPYKVTKRTNPTVILTGTANSPSVSGSSDATAVSIYNGTGNYYLATYNSSAEL